MDLVVTGEVGGAFTGNGQIPVLAVLEHFVRLPRTVLPGPYCRGELAEVDLGVEVGGKVTAMAAGVDVDDVNGIHAVKIGVDAITRIRIDHTGVEADAQYRSDARFLAGLAALPFVVGVPRRRFADLGGILMDGGVHIGGARLDAGLQHRHVQEGRPHVDHYLAAGSADQEFGCLDVHGVQLVRLKQALLLKVAFLVDGLNNRFALGKRARGNMYIAQLAVVLGAFVGNDMGDPAGTDDQDIAFHGCALFKLKQVGGCRQDKLST